MKDRLLVVDDVAKNAKLLADLLAVRGYEVLIADGGRSALRIIESEKPSLVLLDIMMPDMSGYAVCEAIRANPATKYLPVILVTALDPDTERVRGLDAGADDFLSKPVQHAELFARVRSLLRVKHYHDEVQEQARALREWNETLETRVREQVAQVERLQRLKRFLAPALARSITEEDADGLLKPHRREVTIVVLDLRGFSAFTESAEPEEVMELLREYHEIAGNIAMESGGTIERFAGDGMVVIFNDPVPLAEAPVRAARMALTVHRAFRPLQIAWSKRGYSIELGAGMALGYATCGAIGFQGRWDYAAIGSVTNLAARLCSEAKPGQTLTNQKTLARMEDGFTVEPVGSLVLKGFPGPVSAFNIVEEKRH